MYTTENIADISRLYLI